MIRKLKSGKYQLYSRKKDPKTGKQRNLGTFVTMLIDSPADPSQNSSAVRQINRAFLSQTIT